MADRNQANQFSAHLEFRQCGGNHHGSALGPKFEIPRDEPRLPAEMGSGQLHMEPLSCGITLVELKSASATEDVELRIELRQPLYKLTFHLLDTPQTVGLEGLGKPITLRHGDSYVLSPEAIGTMRIPTGEGSHELNLYIPTDRIEALLEDESSEGWMEVAEALYKRGDGPVVDPGILTPAMMLAISQVRSCPFSGSLRSIYLEAKALELMALRLHRIIGLQIPTRQPQPLSRRDREMLRQARYILEQEMLNPPSIGELALRLGTNRTKLKAGYRQLFGTSLFESLRRYRMEQALFFLQECDFNVSETCYAVGYARLSAFSAAFRRIFGFSPSTARTSRPDKLPPKTTPGQSRRTTGSG